LTNQVHYGSLGQLLIQICSLGMAFWVLLWPNLQNTISQSISVLWCSNLLQSTRLVENYVTMWLAPICEVYSTSYVLSSEMVRLDWEEWKKNENWLFWVLCCTQTVQLSQSLLSPTKYWPMGSIMGRWGSCWFKFVVLEWHFGLYCGQIFKIPYLNQFRCYGAQTCCNQHVWLRTM